MPRVKKTAAGEATTTATANPKPEVSTPKGQKIPKSAKKVESMPQTSQNSKKVTSIPETLPTDAKPKPKPAAKPAKPKAATAKTIAEAKPEPVPKPTEKPAVKRTRTKTTAKPETTPEAALAKSQKVAPAKTPEPKPEKNSEPKQTKTAAPAKPAEKTPAKTPAPAGKFPDYIRRAVAGEKVAVKKFEPYGMAVIHGPDGRLSDILLSAWDKDGNLLQYRQPAGAVRVQWVETELAKLETQIIRGER